MKRFESGVRFYTNAQTTVTVHFPEDAVCCNQCRFYDNARHYCWLDKNIVPFRPDRNVGDGCPLGIVEVEV